MPAMGQKRTLGASYSTTSSADKKDTAERIIGFPGQSKRSLGLTRPSDEPDSATVSPIVQRSFSQGDPCRRLLVVRSRLRFRDIGRLEIGSKPPFIGLMVGASDCSVLSNVRFGSLADILHCNRHVRFTPESGHSAVRGDRPLWVKSGHRDIGGFPRNDSASSRR
jgi:hypothetical protein